MRRKRVLRAARQARTVACSAMLPKTGEEIANPDTQERHSPCRRGGPGGRQRHTPFATTARRQGTKNPIRHACKASGAGTADAPSRHAAVPPSTIRAKRRRASPKPGTGSGRLASLPESPRFQARSSQALPFQAGAPESPGGDFKALPAWQCLSFAESF